MVGLDLGPQPTPDRPPASTTPQKPPDQPTSPYDTLVDQLPAAPVEPAAKDAGVQGQYVPDAYDNLLTTQQENEDQQMLQSFHAAVRSSPDLAAEAQRIAGQLGLPADVAERNIDQVRQILAVRQFEGMELSKHSPILARQLRDPAFAKLAQDDLHSLGDIERLFGGFEAGQLTVERGKLYELLRTNRASDRQKERLQWVDQRLRDLPDPRGFIGGGAAYAGQMSRTVPESLVRGMAMGGIFAGGAAIAGQAGPQIALPEEVVTIPAAFATGMSLGTTWSFLWQSYQTEAGNQYGNMLAARNANGTPTYSREQASRGAFVTGTINMVLEGAAGAVLLRTAGITKDVLLNLVRQQAAEQLVRPTLMQSALRFATGHGANIVAEGFTETVQELDQIIQEEVNRDGPSKFSTPEGRKEIVARLVDTALQTAQGMAIIGGIGPGRVLVHDMRQAGAAERSVQFWRELGTAGEKQRGRNPDALEGFLEAAGKGTSAENAYIDAQAFAQVLRQADAAAAEEGKPSMTSRLEATIPGITERIDQAAAAGEDVVLRSAVVGAKLAGTDLYKDLVPHLRLDPNAKSFAEAQVLRQMVQARSDEADQHMAAAEANDRVFFDSARAVEDSIRGQLVAAGRPFQRAQTEAKFYRDLLVTTARRLGVLPGEVHEQRPLRVAAGEIDQQGQVLREGEPPAVAGMQRYTDPAARAADQARLPLTQELLGFLPQTGGGTALVGRDAATGAVRTFSAEETSRLAEKRLDPAFVAAEREQAGPALAAARQGEQAAAAPTKVMVEAKPNTSPVLMAQWEQLTPEQRTMVTRDVLRQIVPQVLQAVGTTGILQQQRGAWLGAPESSIAVLVADPDKAVAVADLLGERLHQEGMFVMSLEPGALLTAGKAVLVTLPEGYTTAQIDELYTGTLWPIKGNEGQDAVVGHSTQGRHMVIGIDPQSAGLTADELAGKLEALLSDEFEVGTADLHTVFRSAGTDYGQTTAAQPGGEGSLAPQGRGGDAGAQTEFDPVYAGAFARAVAVDAGSQPAAAATGALGGSADAAAVGEAGAGSAVLRQDEPTLVAVHNISAGALVAADALGGLPAPSIGITNINDPFQGFGEISLLAPPSIIDPGTGTAVFDADAYTQRFPTLVWKRVPQKAADAFTRWLGKSLGTGEVFDALVNKPNKDRAVQALQASEAGQIRFLEETGRIEKPPMRAKPLRWSWLADEDLLAFTKEHGRDLRNLPFDERDTNPLQATFDALVRQAIDRSVAADLARSTTLDALDTEMLAGPRLREVFGDEQHVLFGKQETILRTIEDVGKQEVDDSVLRQMVGEHRQQFLEWAESKVAPMFEEPRIQLGRRLVPVTLDNVVAAMTKGNVKAREQGMTHGAGKARAQLAKRYKSMAEIRADRDRIVGHTRHTAAVEQASKVLEGYRTLALEHYTGVDHRGHVDTWNGLDDSMRALGALGKKPSRGKVLSALTRFGFKEVSGELVDLAIAAHETLLHTPVDYLEAKPQRAVDLAEFAGAVVPSGTSQAALEVLQRNGVRVREYDRAGGEDARRAALRTLAGEVGDVLFSSDKGSTRGFYRPSDFTIFLTKQQDGSTFLHELSHHYFAMLADLATQKAHPAIVDDFQTLLTWLGVKDTVEWNALPFEAQEKHQEAFARSWETWLWEGKAPSKELEGVFARVAKWMRQVYGTIQGEINAKYRALFGEDLPALTDEVRAVMGRMLASEQSVEEASAVQSMADSFESQAQAGMDDLAWQHHEQVAQQARDEAVASHTQDSLREVQWLSNARAQKLRDLQKQHDLTRAKVRADVVEELQQQPVFRARRWIEHGELVAEDGSVQRQVGGVHRLQTEAVVDLLPPEVDRARVTGKNGFASKDGLLPDVVAKLLGFGTGEELVRALVTTPAFDRVVDVRTDQVMQEEFGHITDPKQREAAVNRALHNEARTRLIAVDLKHISKALQPVRLLIAAAREHARRALGRQTVAQIDQREHVLAEARAARAFTQALKDGDIAAAIDAQRKRLLQHELVKMAGTVLDEIDAGLDTIAKFGGSDKNLGKNRDIDLVYLGRAIAAAFGLGPQLASTQERQLVVSAFAKAEAEHKVLAERVKALLAEQAAGVRNWRDLPLDVFREMIETAESLWSEAGRSKLIEIDGKKQSIESLVAAGVAQIDALPKRSAPGAKARTGKTPGPWERFVLKGWNVVAHLKRFESWAWFMDGGKLGWFHEAFVSPLRASLSRYWKKRREVIALLHPKVLAVRQAAGPAWDAEIAVPEANLGSEPLVLRGLKELLGLLLHAGSLSNLTKALVPYGLAPNPWNTDGILDTSRFDRFIDRMFASGKLTQQHVEFVRSVWAIYKDLLPEDQRTHKALYGFEFATIELREWHTPFGTLEGGYVPAYVDHDKLQSPRPSSVIESLEGEEASFLYSIGTGRGHTLQRNPNYLRPLQLDIAMQVAHIDKQLRFTYLQPAIASSLRVIRNRDFNDALSNYDREAINSIILPMLDNAALQSATRPSGMPMVDAVATWLRQGTSVAALGFNFFNGLLQTTGIGNAAGEVPGRFMRAGVLTLAKNPWAAVNTAMQKSAVMHERFEVRTRRMRDDIARLGRTTSVPGIEEIARSLKKGKEIAARMAFWPQRMLQGAVDTATWHAAYQEHVAKARVDGSLSETELDAEAVAYADGVVKRTQGSGNPEDQAAYESGVPALKLFTQFGGYSNTVLNQVMGAQPGWGPKLRSIGWAILLPAFAEATMRAFLQGVPDDDKDGEKDLDEIALLYTKSLVRNVFGLVPAAGPMVLSLAESDGKRVIASPASSMLQTLWRGLEATGDLATGGDASAFEVRAIGSMLTIVTGWPIVPVTRGIAYDIDVSTGRAPQPANPFDYGRGLLIGR